MDPTFKANSRSKTVLKKRFFPSVNPKTAGGTKRKKALYLRNEFKTALKLREFRRISGRAVVMDQKKTRNKCGSFLSAYMLFYSSLSIAYQIKRPSAKYMI